MALSTLFLGGGVAEAATEYAGIFTAGADSNNLSPNGTYNSACQNITMPSDYGTIQAISYYMRGGGSDTLAIWNTSGTLISGSNISFTAPASAGWATSTYATAPTLSANTTYCIGYTAGTTATFYYWNSLTAGSFYVGGTGVSGTPANISNFSNASGNGAGDQGSFYITYTPSGGSSSPTTFQQFLSWW